MSGRRLIVIGAGPCGLAAAFGAVHRGWQVNVFEQGEVGASLRRWGPTRFFSPLSMNLPPGAAELLAHALPPPDAILTGGEFVDSFLLPFATSPALEGRIQTGSRVVAIGRQGLRRTDYARHPLRAERPFSILVDGPQGEHVVEADAVIDASGTLGQPLAMGAGGTPAPGERACVEVASDPLPERQRVVAGANDLAAVPPSWLRVERRASVLALREGEDGIHVSFTGGREATVDEIAAFTGYRPDLSTLSELAVPADPFSEGAAGLSRALANVTDCLSMPAVPAAELDSGEPGFYLAGAKSYGRSNTFLLQTGYAQIEAILERISRP